MTNAADHIATTTKRSLFQNRWTGFDYYRPDTNLGARLVLEDEGCWKIYSFVCNGNSVAWEASFSHAPNEVVAAAFEVAAQDADDDCLSATPARGLAGLLGYSERQRPAGDSMAMAHALRRSR